MQAIPTCREEGEPRGRSTTRGDHTNLPQQPGAGEVPITLHGRFRKTEHLRRLGVGQPDEEAESDQFRLGCVFRRELSDKIVANCFFGALDEMVTSWMLSEHDYPLAGAADAVVDVILQGMETRAKA